MSPALIIYGLIFIAVLVLVEGIYLTVFGKSISLNSRSRTTWSDWVGRVRQRR